jgi:CheY-like chemotaxis protein
LTTSGPDTPAAEAVSAKRSGAILVIDDEQIVLRTARAALERQGYTVLLAESGSAGVERLRLSAHEVSLIILDLSMPGMSGQETLPELRKIRADVPVLVSSGYSQEETMRLFGGQHVSGFLQKPYTVRHLRESVAAAFAKLSASTNAWIGGVWM